MTPRTAPADAMHNRAAITAARRCGCYHCEGAFLPAAVTEWTDDGRTAICPECGVDAVLPDPAPADLRAAKKLWF